MKFTSIFIVLLFCSLLFQNCSTQNMVEMKVLSKDTMVIYLKQQVSNEKYNFVIRLDSIPEDSRCPTGATCIWAGFVQAKFSISEGNVNHKFTLNTLITPNDTTINGINYKLLDVLPSPDFTIRPTPSEFRAIVAFSKK